MRGLLGEKGVVMRFVFGGVGKFDIKVCAPALGIELLVSEHDTTTLKGPKVWLWLWLWWLAVVVMVIVVMFSLH